MTIRSLHAIHAAARPTFHKGDSAVRYDVPYGQSQPVAVISAGRKWITVRPIADGATHHDDQRFHRDTLTDEGGFHWQLWTQDAYATAAEN